MASGNHGVFLCVCHVLRVLTARPPGASFPSLKNGSRAVPTAWDDYEDGARKGLGSAGQCLGPRGAIISSALIIMDMGAEYVCWGTRMRPLPLVTVTLRAHMVEGYILTQALRG